MNAIKTPDDARVTLPTRFDPSLMIVLLQRLIFFSQAGSDSSLLCVLEMAVVCDFIRCTLYAATGLEMNKTWITSAFISAIGSAIGCLLSREIFPLRCFWKLVLASN